MKLKTLLLAPCFLLPIACDNAPVSDDAAAGFEQPNGKADGQCPDVTGFDICSHSADTVWVEMQVDSETEDSFEHNNEVLRTKSRTGSFRGQSVKCGEQTPSAAPSTRSCTFDVFADDNALSLWLVMGRADLAGTAIINDDEPVNIHLPDPGGNVFEHGPETGFARMASHRQVGVYTCSGAVEFLKTTGDIRDETSDITCTAAVR